MLPRRRRNPLHATCALLLLGTTGSAIAGPLDDPHVGGVGFGGPTTGDLTAVFWNPAALGLMQGTQVTVAGAAQVSSLSVQRSPIDPATGAPGGGRGFPAVTGGTTRWPPGPGSFAAIGAAIGNRFTLALAAYTPFAQRVSFDPAPDGQEPTRYHLVRADLRNVALIPALAFRVGNEVRIGVAPGFLLSSGRLVFDEDTAFAGGTAGATCGAAPCQAEDPAAAARYDVASGPGFFDAFLSLTVAGGVYYRRGPIEIGVAYSSRPLGNPGGGVEISAPDTRVTRPPRLGPASFCPPDRTEGCTYGHIGYSLPDIVTAGVTWNVSPRLSLTGIVRWLTYSLHERIVLRVAGPATGGLRDSGLPERIVLHRGYRDSLEGRVRVARVMTSRLRLGAAVRAASSAVPAAALTPASISGTTIEPALMVELRAPSWLRLTAGYALAWMPAVDTGGASVFDPTAAGKCADSGGDLSTAPCMARVAGTARPTAAGRYSSSQHTLSLTATVRF